LELDSLADIKLAGRAVNGNWPVTQEMREDLLRQLREIAANGDPDEKIAAIKVVLAADTLNAKKEAQQQKQIEAEHARKLQLIELAHKLGIVHPVSGPIGVANSEPSRIANG
jgi:hypothetical protein